MYYFIEGDVPFKEMDRSNLRPFQNMSINKKVRRMIQYMMELEPADRPTLDQISNLSFPFLYPIRLRRSSFPSPHYEENNSD